MKHLNLQKLQTGVRGQAKEPWIRLAERRYETLRGGLAGTWQKGS